MSFLYLVVFTCFLMSCSTYIADSHSYGTKIRPTTDLSQPQFSDQQLPETTWASLFQKSMDAQVNGIGHTMQVKITRLSKSFNDQPLFIVNDRNIGKGFSVISHINANSVQRIKVLRRPNEIALYGNQGRHGVILIKTI